MIHKCISILPKLGANIKRRQATEFMENAEVLGYSGYDAINLLRFLQGGAS